MILSFRHLEPFQDADAQLRKSEALLSLADTERESAGQRAAEDYYHRYGKDAAMLRAGEIVAVHGGSPEAIYALGFWRRTLELTGFTPEEIESSRE